MRSELLCANYIWLRHVEFVARKIRSAVFTTLLIDTGSWLFRPQAVLITDNGISSFNITEASRELPDKSMTSITIRYEECHQLLVRFLWSRHEIYEFVSSTLKKKDIFRLNYERSNRMLIAFKQLYNLVRDINDSTLIFYRSIIFPTVTKSCSHAKRWKE